MIDYSPLYRRLEQNQAGYWVPFLQQQIASAFDLNCHGDLAAWQAIVSALPKCETNYRAIDRDEVSIGHANELDLSQQNSLHEQLMKLHPWRKGPYRIHGMLIDTEWRSDFKWRRIADKITPLTNRLVLDVGCGNGYHCWRMLGAGAGMVVGIDPTLLSVMQFHAIRHFYGEAPVYVLPLRIEDVPEGLGVFDTVFSMGVFYHRRSPFDHLLELRDCLRIGGELILETLVIDGLIGQVLVPEGRYAKMRNVWFIPSCGALKSWMKRAGFVNIELLDVTKTSLEEQRSTEWMRFHSLQDFLDPNNPDLTIEGYPAPTRAVFKAEVK